MKIRPNTDFYARFLGDFSLYYKGREITIGASLQNKSLQMLLMLLRAREEGVERSELLALVRPKEKNVEKRSNNLRQHLHILRKLIAQSVFPEGDYVILEGGRYYFSRTYKVETDVSYLDRLVRELGEEGLSREKREELYLRYCKAYTGEFLPMLGGEEWVIIESAFYQKWYITCLNDTCRRLREKKEYETMLELCTVASQLHPYDEWQAMQIECLMVMDRYKEALEVYEKASSTFYKGLSDTSLDRVMKKYRGKDGRIHYGGNILDKVKQGLEEGAVDSPYYCSYPSFLDAYRIMARIGERMGKKSLLMLCTILSEVWCGPERTDGKKLEDSAHADGKSGDKESDNKRNGGERAIEGKESQERMEQLEAEQRRYIEKQMIQLGRVLTEGLRIGDVYTRYSENQYLVLLVEAGMEDGERIIARLERDWKLMDRDGKARVRFTVQEVEGPGAEGSEDGEKRDICCAYHQPGKSHLAGTGHLAG